MVHGKFIKTSMILDLTWFIEKNQNNTLNLNPPYKRRSVWNRKDRIFFLDTIFNGYPCPAIYLHKTIDNESGPIYHVIDGKQRLETILFFVNNKIRLPKDFDNKNIELAGKTWKEIPIEYKRIFWKYVISVDQFDLIEEINIDEIFERLNRNSRKLESQELRHAKYEGWFISLAEKLSNDYEKLKDLKIVTEARARRMKDTQFISELLMILISGNINGFSQEIIDNYYAYYDDINQNIQDLENTENIDDYEKDEFRNLRKDIDFELIELDFKKIINYIYKMNTINNCVHSYARSFTHFYSLFAFIALTESDKLINIDEISKKYLEFMSLVNAYIAQPKESQMEIIIKYVICSGGASNDLPRRTGRYEALKDYILGN